jgi:hypothetical protein
MNTDTGQGRLEGFLAARVEHLVANGGGIGIPREEDQFTRGSSVIGRKFQINQSITTIVFGQGGAKILVRGRARTLAFNDNGFLVLNHVNVITQLFALLQFERIEQIAHFLVGHDTGRLYGLQKNSCVIGETEREKVCTCNRAEKKRVLENGLCCFGLHYATSQKRGFLPAQ